MRHVVRALRWLLVCALLTLPLRAPIVERAADAVVMLALAQPDGDDERTPARREPSASPRCDHVRSAGERGARRIEDGARAVRLYLQHCSLLL
jgi:hypothetical protein